MFLFNQQYFKLKRLLFYRYFCFRDIGFSFFFLCPPRYDYNLKATKRETTTFENFHVIFVLFKLLK